MAFSKWVQDSSWKGALPKSIAPLEFVERILLGLGLALQQLNYVLFTEPDEYSPDMPGYCLNAGMPAWDAITEAVARLQKVAER